VVISIYYYFGWIQAAFFPVPAGDGFGASEPPRPVITRVGFPVAAAMVLLAAGSVILGFYQGRWVVWLVSR